MEFINIIDDLYHGSTTKIITNKFASDDIDVKIGTKQGCPVSPLLFNLCLEPLFEAIIRINRQDGYSFKIGDVSKSFHILAYADDILLISESVTGMENMLRTCERFCAYSRMKLAPAKSCSIGYLFQNRRRCSLENNFRIGNEPIPIIKLDSSMRYLGTPIAARKVAKLQNSTDYFLKFQEKALKIFESDLLEVQKLHAIRTFLIPTLDFALLNGQLKIKHLNKLDGLIGKAINDMIGGAVPNPVKHASWKDGGLSIPSLTEKSDTGRVKSLIWMITNKDNLIKSLIHTAIEDERKLRRFDIENDPNQQYFFNWKGNPTSMHAGTNSIVQRARGALHNLDLTLTVSYDDCFREDITDGTVFSIPNQLDPENLPTTWKLRDTVIDKEVIFSSPKNISLFLCNCRRERWKRHMNNQTFHLHSMYSFNDCPITNEFLVRQKWPIQDNIFNFAMRSRLNMLPTPQFDEVINGYEHVPCPKCLRQGNQCIQTLAHILNGCVGKYKEYTKRHNMVLDVISDFLRSRSDIVELYKDRTMHIDDLPEELASLRPDIVAWTNGRTKCVIAEIGVPYATHNMGIEKLEEVYGIKKNKYLPICNHLRSNGIVVEHYTIIVSSLGAIYKESLKELRPISQGDSKAFKTLIKRISMNALIGSMDVWQSWSHRSSSNTNADLADDEDSNDYELYENDSLSELSGDATDDDDEIASQEQSPHSTTSEDPGPHPLTTGNL